MSDTTTCPVCHGPNNNGLYACWECWNKVIAPEINRLNRQGMVAQKHHVDSFITNYHRKQKLAAL